MGSRADALSPRKEEVLRAVVECYIAGASPVGSGTVYDSQDFGVSPATIRKEMLALEQAGYLQQPHTSSGRVPTEAGYRYFVDALMEPYSLGPEAVGLHEGVDEVAVAGLGGDPARGGVRLLQVPGLLQRQHLLADRRRGDTEVLRVVDGARANRGGAGDIALHHGAQDLLLAR